MGTIIAVTSGKGGTGKTATVAALSSCLAVMGYKTLCIDFDAGLRNLDLALNMSDFTVKDYIDVVNGESELMAACSESPQIPNLFFLTAPAEKEHFDTNVKALAKMFDDVRENFDYCLIDAPAGIGLGFKLALCNVDMAIIVTTGELPAMRDAVRTANAARDAGVANLRLIVNRVLPENFKIMKSTVDDIIDTTGVRLLGLIAEDSYISRALNESIPLVLYEKRKSAYDFLHAALRIAGEDVPLFY
jgi:septum site-determining protein MinD